MWSLMGEGGGREEIPMLIQFYHTPAGLGIRFIWSTNRS